VYLTGDGLLGLHDPAGTRWTSSSPVVHGSQFRGWIAGEREVFWPILVYSEVDSPDWLYRYRAFWRTIDPRQTGVWSVTTPDGGTRTLTCRGNPDGTSTYEVDPLSYGWSAYGVRLIAEDPFWYGTPETYTWGAGDSQPVFGGPGVINISRSSDLTTATISNAGDVEAYVQWTIRGPVKSAQLGAAGRPIVVPFAVAAGRELVVDTRPTAMSAIERDVDGGNTVDRTEELGTSSWVAVAAGNDVALSLALASDGPGSFVRADLTPRFYRAF
jgi:hypothetical protein